MTEFRGTKWLDYVSIEDGQGASVRIPLGVLSGAMRGPVLTVIGGIHGTEYSAHTAVREFWEALEPEQVRGEVRVVLLADPLAAEAHSPYRNPIDGKNLNRVWPGSSAGTITDRIAHELTRRVVQGASALVDVHSGEWDQSIEMWAFTHHVEDDGLNDAARTLALATGYSFVEYTPADGQVLGAGTVSGEAMRHGVPAVTLEAGGGGVIHEDSVRRHLAALRNVLMHLRMSPLSPAPWAGTPVELERTHHLVTQTNGRFVPAYHAGDWIPEGATVAEILDASGTRLETMVAPEAGTLLYILRAPYCEAGRFVAKVGVPAQKYRPKPDDQRITDRRP
jgi:predicted deacylase